jgi:hypothetical protein
MKYGIRSFLAMSLVLAVPAGAETTAALALARALAISRTQPVTILAGSTMACAAVDKPTVRRCARYRNVHLFECVNQTSGEVNGAVLTDAGRVRCTVTGTTYRNGANAICAQVTVCGTAATACLDDPATLGTLRCLGLL